MKPKRTLDDHKIELIHDILAHTLSRVMYSLHLEPKNIYRTPQYQRISQNEYLDNIHYNSDYKTNAVCFIMELF